MDKKSTEFPHYLLKVAFQTQMLVQNKQGFQLEYAQVQGVVD